MIRAGKLTLMTPMLDGMHALEWEAPLVRGFLVFFINYFEHYREY
ncbi:MAG: hypothetical protein K0Q56_775 [Sporolactobacillus laevolacticus]|nr:hypothetical protein [Sporolactobacillus laevolacticus]